MFILIQLRMVSRPVSILENAFIFSFLKFMFSCQEINCSYFPRGHYRQSAIVKKCLTACCHNQRHTHTNAILLWSHLGYILPSHTLSKRLKTNYEQSCCCSSSYFVVAGFLLFSTLRRIRNGQMHWGK